MYPQGLYREDYDPRYEKSWLERAQFEYKYCFWPRRCYKTGRWLWLETAMRGRAIWFGPGEPVVDDRWFNSNEALIIMLKKVSE